IGTALADDPLLTARPPGPRTLLRVVLDSAARLPLGSRLVATARETSVLIAANMSAEEGKVEALRQLGCEGLRLPAQGQRPSVAALLDELGRRRMTNVLVEGGAAVLGSFLDARAVDAVHVFIAPRLAGGAGAKSPVGGAGVEAIAAALPLKGWRVETVADNLLVEGWVCSGRATGVHPGGLAALRSGRKEAAQEPPARLHVGQAALAAVARDGQPPAVLDLFQHAEEPHPVDVAVPQRHLAGRAAGPRHA